MPKKYDIKVGVVEHLPYKGKDFEEIEYKFTGKDVHIKIINSIRRACEENIPVYGIPRELIIIPSADDNTTTAYTNDQMKTRLVMLPLMNPLYNGGKDIDPKLDYLHEKYWRDIDYLNEDRLIHEAEKSIEIQIAVKNDSKEKIWVNTNHPGVKVYVDTVKVDMYSKEYPILLIKLQPGQQFNCSMKAVLGIGEEHAKWKSCTNGAHFYLDDDITKDIHLRLIVSGQLNGRKVAGRACSYLIKKLGIIQNKMISQIKKHSIGGGKVFFKLDGEDNTIGELINLELQDHKDVIFSGLTTPDYLVKGIVIKVNFAGMPGSDKLVKILNDCFDSAVDKQELFKEEFNKSTKSRAVSKDKKVKKN